MIDAMTYGSDVLGVTVGHPDDVGVDRHEPTRRLLPIDNDGAEDYARKCGLRSEVST